MAEGAPLAGSPLFGLLAPSLQEELVGVARPLSVKARDWLFHEGDAGDCIYVVVSGRMRVVAEREDEPRVLDTLGPGAVLGELAILTGARRSASVQAVRDTELLEIDGVQFELLLGQDPALGVGLARALAERIQRGDPVSSPEAPTAVVTMAAGRGTDAERLWDELEAAFSELGDSWTQDKGGLDSADPHEWGRQLGELERAYDFVLLRTELGASEWARFCVRQADRIVVAAGRDPLADAELIDPGSDLVFLQTPTVDKVGRWFEQVAPRAHYVVRSDADLSEASRRLARRLTGRSLGVVLSGGGARAYAHIGVLDVLAAEGIVVDRFGGCSLGAFVAAMAALGWTAEEMSEVCTHEVARRTPFNDYTFPRHALIRMRRAASMLKRVFGEVAIEQLAWPLFTVSADLLSSRMVVHRAGPVLEAVGASMAIPGVAPPVARRSELLVDGGVLNNLPIDVMVAGEPGPVIGVDVVRRLERTDPSSDEPQALLPTIFETLSRATVLGSVERADANRDLATLLITPDVQDIPLRGFRHLARAVDAGRRAAEEALAAGGKEALEEAQRRGARVRLEASTIA